MKDCTRIEIVIEKALARTMADLLIELNSPGYTMIDHAVGRGDRGERRGDDPTGASTNCVFIVACESREVVDRIVEGVRPLLTQSGGMCLLSEAILVKH
ncbi:MAG: transcriptional regulator [Pseudomonadales bacterium]|jgi:hypothetical protein|nr:transcriptional regulator [Pseudomonadales bacterium]